jgi:hypothetical protein
MKPDISIIDMPSCDEGLVVSLIHRSYGVTTLCEIEKTMIRMDNPLIIIFKNVSLSVFADTIFTYLKTI